MRPSLSKRGVTRGATDHHRAVFTALIHHIIVRLCPRITVPVSTQEQPDALVLNKMLVDSTSLCSVEMVISKNQLHRPKNPTNPKSTPFLIQPVEEDLQALGPKRRNIEKLNMFHLKKVYTHAQTKTQNCHC